MTAAPNLDDGGVDVRLDATEIQPEAKPEESLASGGLYAGRDPAPDRTDVRKEPKLDDYEQDWSDKVRKRIGVFRARLGDAERDRDAERSARQAAESKAAAAAADRDRILAEAQDANARVYGQALGQWERANKAERARLQIDLSAANAAVASGEDGAADRLAELQSAMANLAAEESKVAEAKANYRPPSERKPAAEADGEETRQVRRTEQPEMPESRRQWLAKQAAWWQRDGRKTKYALYLDDEARGSGIKADSPEYFAFIDKGLAEKFEDMAGGDDDLDELLKPRRPASAEADIEVETEPAAQPEARRSPVAPSSRPATPGARPSAGNVRLSADQVQIARSLNLSNQQYAAYLVKAQRDGRIGRNR